MCATRRQAWAEQLLGALHLGDPHLAPAEREQGRAAGAGVQAPRDGRHQEQQKVAVVAPAHAGPQEQAVVVLQRASMATCLSKSLFAACFMRVLPLAG